MMFAYQNFHQFIIGPYIEVHICQVFKLFIWLVSWRYNKKLNNKILPNAELSALNIIENLKLYEEIWMLKCCTAVWSELTIF